jgi:hypothetical protein
VDFLRNCGMMLQAMRLLRSRPSRSIVFKKFALCAETTYEMRKMSEQPINIAG